MRTDSNSNTAKVQSAGNNVPRIVELADRLEADIVAKGLQRGDPYLSTVAVAEMLQVGGGLANRVMQMLEKRQILVRRQRKGAYIMHLPHQSPPGEIGSVHLLVHEKYLQTEGVNTDGLLLGVQSELPRARTTLNFLPGGAEAPFAEDLVMQSLASGDMQGFVLIRASFEAQQVIAASGLPAVVNGSLYPSIKGLSCIERDLRGAVRVLAHYLLEKGRQQVAFFGRQLVLPGDHVTLDSLRDIFGGDALWERYLPAAEEVITEEARLLLSGRRRPTGFVCLSERLADGVARAVRELGMEPQRDVGITVLVYFPKPGQTARYPCARLTLSDEEIGQHIGRMLSRQARGKRAEPEHEQIAVALEVPGSDGEGNGEEEFDAE